MKKIEIKNGKVTRNDFIGTNLTLDLKFTNNKTGEVFGGVISTDKGLYKTEGLAWQNKLHYIFSLVKSKKWKYENFDLVGYELNEFSEKELWGTLIDESEEYSIF